MREYLASTFTDLHELVRGFYNVGGVGWIFRGQADAAWPVVPKAGRPEYGNGKDLGRFNAWRRSACAFASLPENAWECLAIAQHHGLATRLLDWTTNPLVAAYFAVGAHPQSDGAVYCYLPDTYVDVDLAKMEAVNRVAAYIPRPVVRRIASQGGLFTYHPSPSDPLQGEAHEFLSGRNDLERIRIPSAAKTEFLATLDVYGVNEVGLFPDLDGLSRHVNWETTSMIARRRTPTPGSTG